MARPDSRGLGGRREAGREAARRLKEILRAGSELLRPLPLPSPPPSFAEERRPLGLGLGRLRRPVEDDQDD